MQNIILNYVCLNLFKITFTKAFHYVKNKCWPLLIIFSRLFFKLHVIRQLVGAVHPAGEPVSRVCAWGWRGLCRGRADRGERSWRGWEGRCPVRRLFPSTRSYDLSRRNIRQNVSNRLNWRTRCLIEKTYFLKYSSRVIIITREESNKVTISSLILFV